MGMKKGKWDEHLEEAEKSGQRFAQYAAKHGIDVHRLYEARQRHGKWRARASVSGQQSRRAAEAARGAFMKVKLARRTVGFARRISAPWGTSANQRIGRSC